MSRKRKREFQQLLERHGPLLGRIAESYTAPGGDREDLLQDIALALWQAWPYFRGECAEKTFVVRVAHNRGLHFVYKRGRNPQGVSDLELIDLCPSPEDVADAGQRRERLLTAIRALPLPYLQVVTLALEDMPHEEIGEALGLSIGNVAVRLHRAREMLRGALGRKK